MQDVNSITLVGRLTRDPELRSTASGLTVASLRLAYTQSRKSASGQWEEEPGFIDVSVFGNQADVVGKFLAKGRQIVVQGRLDFRQWANPEGQQRSATQIVANQVQFIGGQENGQTQRASNPVAAQSNPSNAPADDDSIPF
jgi:single-strand DNA-binding protein